MTERGCERIGGLMAQVITGPSKVCVLGWSGLENSRQEFGVEGWGNTGGLMLEEINKRGGKRRGVPCYTPPSHSLFHSHVPIYGSAFPISKTPHVEKRERERKQKRLILWRWICKDSQMIEHEKGVKINFDWNCFYLNYFCGCSSKSA